MAEFRLPDLEAEYSEEEGERLDEALERYKLAIKRKKIFSYFSPRLLQTLLFAVR